VGLVNCIDCNKSISDKAESCPNCGCPAWAINNDLNTCYKCNAPLKPNAIKCDNCQNPYVIKNTKTKGYRKAYKWEVDQFSSSNSRSNAVKGPTPEKTTQSNQNAEIPKENANLELDKEERGALPSKPQKEVLNDIQLSGSQKAGVKEQPAESDPVQSQAVDQHNLQNSRGANFPWATIVFIIFSFAILTGLFLLGKSHKEQNLAAAEQAHLKWVKDNQAKIQEYTNKPAQFTNKTTRIYDKPEGSVRYTLGKGSRLYAYEKIGEWVRVSKSGELTNWVMESDIRETARQKQVARKNPIKNTVESAERKSTKPVDVDLIDGWEAIPMNYCTTCTQGYQAVGVWNKGKGLVQMIVAARDNKGRYYSGRKYDCGASPQVAYYNSASDTLGGVWSSSDVNTRRLSIRGESTNAPVKDLGVYACHKAGY